MYVRVLLYKVTYLPCPVNVCACVIVQSDVSALPCWCICVYYCTKWRICLALSVYVPALLYKVTYLPCPVDVCSWITVQSDNLPYCGLCLQVMAGSWSEYQSRLMERRSVSLSAIGQWLGHHFHQQSVNQSVSQSSHQLIKQSINQSTINQSINQSINIFIAMCEVKMCIHMERSMMLRAFTEITHSQ